MESGSICTTKIVRIVLYYILSSKRKLPLKFLTLGLSKLLVFVIFVAWWWWLLFCFPEGSAMAILVTFHAAFFFPFTSPFGNV